MQRPLGRARAFASVARCVGGQRDTGILAAPFAHANIVDGSFESPVVPAGSFTDFASGSQFGPGNCWTVVGAGSVSIVSGTFTQGGITYGAAAGAQWLDLTGSSSNSVTGVQQTWPTTAGQSYKVKFAVGAITTPSEVKVMSTTGS